MSHVNGQEKSVPCIGGLKDSLLAIELMGDSHPLNHPPPIPSDQLGFKTLYHAAPEDGANALIELENIQCCGSRLTSIQHHCRPRDRRQPRPNMAVSRAQLAQRPFDASTSRAKVSNHAMWVQFAVVWRAGNQTEAVLTCRRPTAGSEVREGGTEEALDIKLVWTF